MEFVIYYLKHDKTLNIIKLSSPYDFTFSNTYKPQKRLSLKFLKILFKILKLRVRDSGDVISLHGADICQVVNDIKMKGRKIKTIRKIIESIEPFETLGYLYVR
jgi:hypothetical protein